MRSANLVGGSTFYLLLLHPGSGERRCSTPWKNTAAHRLRTVASGMLIRLVVDPTIAWSHFSSQKHSSTTFCFSSPSRTME